MIIKQFESFYSDDDDDDDPMQKVYNKIEEVEIGLAKKKINISL